MTFPWRIFGVSVAPPWFFCGVSRASLWHSCSVRGCQISQCSRYPVIDERMLRADVNEVAVGADESYVT